jgi:hypothetical protein
VIFSDTLLHVNRKITNIPFKLVLFHAFLLDKIVCPSLVPSVFFIFFKPFIIPGGGKTYEKDM